MGSVKTFSEMLKSVKSYNKEAREGKAKKEGFKTASDLILYLDGAVKNGKGGLPYSPPDSTSKGSSKKTTSKSPAKSVVSKGTTCRPLIHVADVLDASGSMSGSKFTAAMKGINIGIEHLKSDTAEVDYTYTLCDFSTDVNFKHVRADLSRVGVVRGTTRSSTSLYDAIGQTVQIIRQDGYKPTDKVLVNIYTDGQENSSKHYNVHSIATLIEELSTKGWTFTFIGTKEDVAFAQSNLKFDSSNTLVYDGTGAGLEKSLATNTAARSAYSQKVSAGEDASIGFYKDIK